jgi:hypothetical protein
MKVHDASAGSGVPLSLKHTFSPDVWFEAVVGSMYQALFLSIVLGIQFQADLVDDYFPLLLTLFLAIISFVTLSLRSKHHSFICALNVGASSILVVASAIFPVLNSSANSVAVRTMSTCGIQWGIQLGYLRVNGPWKVHFWCAWIASNVAAIGMCAFDNNFVDAWIFGFGSIMVSFNPHPASISFFLLRVWYPFVLRSSDETDTSLLLMACFLLSTVLLPTLPSI